MDQLPGSNIIKVGIDLTEFYLSVEWDILAVPATRNEEYYPDNNEPFSGTYCFYFLVVRFTTNMFAVAFRYNFQNYNEEKNSVLYCKPYYSVCGYYIPYRIGFLLAISFWREGKFL